MTTERVNGLSCLCCVFSAVWGAAAHNQRTNKERRKEMDKSPGCDHQYPNRPKPRKNSLKDSEFNICIIEVICTKRMLLKRCIFFSERVCEKGRSSEGGKGSAGGARPVLRCKRRWRKSVVLKVLQHCCNRGFPENSYFYVQYKWMISFSEASVCVIKRGNAVCFFSEKPRTFSRLSVTEDRKRCQLRRPRFHLRKQVMKVTTGVSGLQPPTDWERSGGRAERQCQEWEMLWSAI